MDWKKLQNGSDIRGVAIDGIEGEKVNLDGNVAYLLGRAFLIWLGSNSPMAIKPLKIAIGRDPRITGNDLKKAISSGISAESGKVYDAGIASTPAMFMSTQFEEYGMNGAIMITASHLPFNRNGMKFFTPVGGLEKKDISAILEIAEQLDNTSSSETRIEKIDLMDRYSTHLRDIISNGIDPYKKNDLALKGFKIIVDAGNGSGGFFASKVLEPLGAEIQNSLFLEPDGMFPNHIPNPENSEAMQAITEAVIHHKADLGIIFDTDVDRAAFVDHQGNPMNRNSLIALVSAIVLEKHPQSWIVTDSITSDGLNQFINLKLKGKHHRFKRGYRNVINEGISLDNNGKECHLAIETSGHAAIKENQWLDDGAYLAALILVKMARMKIEGQGMLADLIVDLTIPLESEEYRIKILDENFKDRGLKILHEIEAYSKKIEGWSIVPDNFEGIRVKCDKNHGDGWFLLRMSLHDPVMPLNIESESSGGVNFIQRKLIDFFNTQEGLDISVLKNS